MTLILFQKTFFVGRSSTSSSVEETPKKGKKRGRPSKDESKEGSLRGDESKDSSEMELISSKGAHLF